MKSRARIELETMVLAAVDAWWAKNVHGTAVAYKGEHTDEQDDEARLQIGQRLVNLSLNSERFTKDDGQVWQYVSAEGVRK